MIVTNAFFKDHSAGDIFSFYLIGDLHLGTIFCCEHEIEKYIKLIEEDPLAYWIGMGDMGEYITPSDKRWDDGVVAKWLHPDNIAEDIRIKLNDIFTPIKGKCLGMLWGNHERSFRKFNYGNVHQNLCNDFGVRNLGFSCFIHFKFQRKSSQSRRLFKGAFTHGTGSATTDTAKKKKLLDFMDRTDAHFYGYAHTHACDVSTKIYLGTNVKKSRLKSLNKVGLLTGCFFKTYGESNEASYGEQKLYAPLPIGCGVIRVNPHEGTYKGEILI